MSDQPAANPPPGPPRLVILMPVLDDWVALDRLLGLIDPVLLGAGLGAEVLVVDDGSTRPIGDRCAGPYRAIGRVEVLHLRRNLGHQRAIAVGLAALEAERPGPDLVAVMDSDGEDDPSDIPRLVAACEASGRSVMVFAERTKRSETPLFRACYRLYRVVHRVLTGRSVRVGNFSVVPRARLSSLVAVSELWNHYAAAAFTTRQPVTMIPTARGRRLDGRSRMNFVGLVIHGLSAISVHSDIIGVRLMLATLGLIGLDGLALLTTFAVRVFTDRAIPGWATTAFGVLLILLVQATLFLFVSSFMILAGRNAAGFLPSRDHVHFVGSREEVYRR